MPDTKVYDLNGVNCNFLGIPIDSGFGENTAFVIERGDPDFTTKVGADGEVTRSRTGTRLCKITITLMQSSSGNAVLSTINQLDRSAPNGAGIGPLALKDSGGTSTYIFGKAWIEGPPPKVEFAKEATEREWVFGAVEDVRFDGGN